MQYLLKHFKLPNKGNCGCLLLWYYLKSLINFSNRFDMFKQIQTVNYISNGPQPLLMYGSLTKRDKFLLNYVSLTIITTDSKVKGGQSWQQQ